MPILPPIYTLNGQERYVRQRIVDNVSDSLSYIGEHMSATAATSSGGWRIKRVLIDGDITREQLAGDGQFVNVWDSRATYFDAPPAPTFTDAYSLRFDGVNDYVNFGNINNFQRTDVFSVSAWIRLDNPGVQQFILGKATGTTGQGWALLNLSASLGRMTFMLTSVNNTNQIRVTTTNTVLSSNTYSHFVVTYDGTSLAAGVKLYVNGVDEPLTVVVNNLVGSTQTGVNMTAGAASSGSTPTAGYIDELSVYNKVLSGADVTRLYNGGEPTDLASEDGLVNWWRMGDGDIYPVALDSKDTRNGIMTNMDVASITTVVPG